MSSDIHENSIIYNPLILFALFGLKSLKFYVTQTN